MLIRPTMSLVVVAVTLLLQQSFKESQSLLLLQPTTTTTRRRKHRFTSLFHNTQLWTKTPSEDDLKLESTDINDGNIIQNNNNNNNNNADDAWAREQAKLRAYVEHVRKERNAADAATMDAVEGGIACTGEPSVDPSRTIHPNQGDSEWMDDW